MVIVSLLNEEKHNGPVGFGAQLKMAGRDGCPNRGLMLAALRG